MYDFMRRVEEEILSGAASTVEFDLAATLFVDNDGVVALSNYVQYLNSRGVTVSFTNLSPTGAAKYLDDCGFFKHFCGSEIWSFSDLRKTTMPFRSLFCTQSAAWLEGEFSVWMHSRFGARGYPLDRMRTCLRELFNNIQDHSSVEIGCFHAQWYPNRKLIGISLADFGMGIPTSIREKYDIADDTSAIEHALTRGVTTKNERNMGVGLAYLVETVVDSSGGRVQIFSQNGHLARGGQGWVKQAVPGFFPGTLFSLTLPDSGWVGDDDEEEELEW